MAVLCGALLFHGSTSVICLFHRSTSVLHCCIGALLCSVASWEHFCALLVHRSTAVLCCFMGALLCSVASREHFCALLLHGSTSVLHSVMGAPLCMCLAEVEQSKVSSPEINLFYLIYYCILEPQI